MKRDTISRKKADVFPWIRDWTDPQDKHRYEKNVNKLSWGEWFWLHPSAYTLLLFGTPVLTTLIMVFIGAYIYYKGFSSAFLLIPVFFIGISLWDFYNKLKNKTPGLTFYDIYMREYKREDGE